MAKRMGKQTHVWLPDPLSDPSPHPPGLAELTDGQRAEAMARLAVLRPHLEDDVPLTACATEADVPRRTVQRWLARYRRDGLVGLARPTRSDAGHRRVADECVALIEGLALQRPQASIAAIYRRVRAFAERRELPAPSYATVHAIVGALDPAMVVLAHKGPAAWRDRYELIHRHRAERPNALWQADHTVLDILVLDAAGRAERPWLTVVIDDHSRAVAGYTLFAGAPSALNLSLALRQAIWRKGDPDWPVCGIPDVLHVDHGTDFTSTHLSQVAAALRTRLVHSAVGRPQGRGKVERFFGTLNAELLSDLPGRIVGGTGAVPKPSLTLTELDRAIGDWITGTYNHRTHSQTGAAPVACWLAGAGAEGWLPRMPDSLEELDLLLVMVAKPRVVRRDGIRFGGLRYVDAALAPFVGEWITVRYDPRDLAEIRLFHKNRFVCRAVSPELTGETVALADIQAARTARRRALRRGIEARTLGLVDLLDERPSKATNNAANVGTTKPGKAEPTPRSRLRLYSEDD